MSCPVSCKSGGQIGQKALDNSVPNGVLGRLYDIFTYVPRIFSPVAHQRTDRGTIASTKYIYKNMATVKRATSAGCFMNSSDFGICNQTRVFTFGPFYALRTISESHVDGYIAAPDDVNVFLQAPYFFSGLDGSVRESEEPTSESPLR